MAKYYSANNVKRPSLALIWPTLLLHFADLSMYADEISKMGEGELARLLMVSPMLRGAPGHSVESDPNYTDQDMADGATDMEDSD
jgi:hypothetical protein